MKKIEIETLGFRNLHLRSFPRRNFRTLIINEVICSTSSRRKPGWRFTAGSTSTQFPHGALVECLSNHPFLLFLKSSNFHLFSIFLKFIICSKFLEICDPINLALALTFLHLITSIWIFNIHSTRFSLRLHVLHGAKPCQLDQIWSMLYHFSRPSVWQA